MLEAGVLDTYLGKYWAVKLATNAAVTVLRVDQVRGRGETPFLWLSGEFTDQTTLCPFDSE